MDAEVMMEARILDAGALGRSDDSVNDSNEETNQKQSNAKAIGNLALSAVVWCLRKC
ncbi:hypothetical protein KIN20_010167 [Parelaphostrongylus tenuis]|uniref:Uncharacterized protein n=1 Tax=Parelaphostrongylus tenuis TaxID=148309 RepID=A0AAD5M979_PARTN|nr:hypothetical protein KIN20_010167 [Parelaphostrongylus tenuis]